MALNNPEIALAFFEQALKQLDSLDFEEKKVIEKDGKKQIEKLEKIIILKNSFGTKMKNGFETLQTP